MVAVPPNLKVLKLVVVVVVVLKLARSTHAARTAVVTRIVVVIVIVRVDICRRRCQSINQTIDPSICVWDPSLSKTKQENSREKFVGKKDAFWNERTLHLKDDDDEEEEEECVGSGRFGTNAVLFRCVRVCFLSRRVCRRVCRRFGFREWCPFTRWIDLIVTGLIA